VEFDDFDFTVRLTSKCGSGGKRVDHLPVKLRCYAVSHRGMWGRSLNSELLQGFYLGNLLIEPLKGQVTDRAESRHLPPKAVEVLLCLAREPGDLVTREDLLSAVWGSGHGSQEALSHAVSEIRHALDDHPDSPQYIQTLPRRGYRLLVEPLSEPPEETVRTAPSGFWESLFRHGVVQASAAYLVVGWLLIQVADATFVDLGLPVWSKAFVTFTVIAGFPLLGLERNYLAIFVAYVVSAASTAFYQAIVGFDIAEHCILPGDCWFRHRTT